MARPRVGSVASFQSSGGVSMGNLLPPTLEDENGDDIRPESPRLQQAMLMSGVLQDKLMLHPYESFLRSGKDVTLPIIAKKRFEAAKSHRDENVRLVLQARMRLIRDSLVKERFRGDYEERMGANGDTAAKAAAEQERRLAIERKHQTAQLEAARRAISKEKEVRAALEVGGQEELARKIAAVEAHKKSIKAREKQMIARRYQQQQEAIARLRKQEEEERLEVERAKEFDIKWRAQEEQAVELHKSKEEEYLRKKLAFNEKHLETVARLKDLKRKHDAELVQVQRELAASLEQKEARRVEIWSERLKEVHEENAAERSAHEAKKKEQIAFEQQHRAALEASWASSVAAMQKRLSQLEKAKRAERRRMQREDFARVQAVRDKKKLVAEGLEAEKKKAHADKWQTAQVRHAELLEERKITALIRAEELRLATVMKEEIVKRELRQREYKRAQEVARVEEEDKKTQRKQLADVALAERRKENARVFLYQKTDLRRLQEQEVRSARAAKNYFGKESAKLRPAELEGAVERLAHAPSRKGAVNTRAGAFADDDMGFDIPTHRRYMGHAKRWLRDMKRQESFPVSARDAAVSTPRPRVTEADILASATTTTPAPKAVWPPQSDKRLASRSPRRMSMHPEHMQIVQQEYASQGAMAPH